MNKKSVEFVPQGGHYKGNERLYRVVKTTNTVEPVVGELVGERAIKELIRRPGWTVIIKEGRE